MARSECNSFVFGCTSATTGGLLLSIKDKVLARLATALRADLRYAEIMARHHAEKLVRLGWGARRARTPLRAPGEVRDIRIVAEGDTCVELEYCVSAMNKAGNGQPSRVVTAEL